MSEISDAPEVRRAHRSELDPVTFLLRSEFVYPDKVAVVHEERRYTYREMGERVRRLASGLRDAGLEKGDRVAFIAPSAASRLAEAASASGRREHRSGTFLHCSTAHYGVPAGGVLVAINYRLNSADVEFILEHAGARFVFADHEFAELGNGASVERTVRIDDTGEPDDPYEAFLAVSSPDPLPSVPRSTTRRGRRAAPRAPSTTTAAPTSTHWARSSRRA
jgi:fatty-acyl-CoA synthase